MALRGEAEVVGEIQLQRTKPHLPRSNHAFLRSFSRPITDTQCSMRHAPSRAAGNGHGRVGAQVPSAPPNPRASSSPSAIVLSVV